MTLETKWRNWVEAESFKRSDLPEKIPATFSPDVMPFRLAFHTLIHDAQTSIALLVPPIISYAEMSLEMPASQALWLAKNAYTWRDSYLANDSSPTSRLPSLTHCIHDVLPLAKVQHRIDLRMSVSIVLHGIWSLIWEHRQLDSLLKLQPPNHRWNGALISTSWHQELCRILNSFRVTVSDWNGGVRPEMIMTQELFMMNLHVSFEELQLFAGKEGHEEARRVYPFLREWFEGRESRQAVWHAGQVIRAATSCHPTHLRDIHAIALYHASLAFWAYGMISLAISRRNSQSASPANSATGGELVWLDGEDTSDTRRLIALQRGILVIRDWSKSAEQREDFVLLDDVQGVMEVIIAILRKNCNNDGKSLSSLVENLAQLMRDLGHAAWVFSSRL
jgi:hypothetical protein